MASSAPSGRGATALRILLFATRLLHLGRLARDHPRPVLGARRVFDALHTLAACNATRVEALLLATAGGRKAKPDHADQRLRAMHLGAGPRLAALDLAPGAEARLQGIPVRQVGVVADHVGADRRASRAHGVGNGDCSGARSLVAGRADAVTDDGDQPPGEDAVELGRQQGGPIGAAMFAASGDRELHLDAVVAGSGVGRIHLLRRRQHLVHVASPSFGAHLRQPPECSQPPMLGHHRLPQLLRRLLLLLFLLGGLLRRRQIPEGGVGLDLCEGRLPSALLQLLLRCQRDPADDDLVHELAVQVQNVLVLELRQRLVEHRRALQRHRHVVLAGAHLRPEGDRPADRLEHAPQAITLADDIVKANIGHHQRHRHAPLGLLEAAHMDAR
mmetsp:Transcript_114193/g.329843  ORF Transcript_114193/g.329843 Transcript_114193/m.329843 type:complete len:387 (+) Transcript_114193:1849-3009(+)